MAEYIRYEIENLEPLRIADDSSSHMGQTSTLHYIPGTTMRGFVINRMSRREDFSGKKAKFFTNQIRFLNAYPMVTEDNQTIELIPSPKGFYEDKFIKEKKELENVLVNEQFPEGYKRAAVGEFAWIKKDKDSANEQDMDENSADYVLHCMRVPLGSDLKIKINTTAADSQTVFRNEYIAAGNRFAGYAITEDETDGELLKELLQGDIILGNGRSAGLGKCRVSNFTTVHELPYKGYSSNGDADGYSYMMALSHTAMRNHISGEYCGIDTVELAGLLGVSNLEIEKCATSVVDVRGYNRKWGVRIPSITMYEKGSVFKLKFDGVISEEKLKAVMDRGIGVRRNEGFGRVIFLKDYEKIKYRTDFTAFSQSKEQPIENREILTDEDAGTLRTVARNYYRNLFNAALERYIVDLNWKRGNVSTSKIAKIEAFTTAFRFDYRKAQENIEKYFVHAREKQRKERVQRASHSDISDIDRYVTDVFNWSLPEMEEAIGIVTKDPERVMGILKVKAEDKSNISAFDKDKYLFSDEEIGRMKLEILTRVIRFDYKKGD